MQKGLRGLGSSGFRLCRMGTPNKEPQEYRRTVIARHSWRFRVWGPYFTPFTVERLRLRGLEGSTDTNS